MRRIQPEHSPKLSIGLPVYNGEAYLEQALACIRDQTESDYELLISDNASTDRTEEICRDYAAADPRIRYRRNSENVGAARNFNALFHKARGRFFKWASHDDRMAPTFLAECVEVLELEPRVGLCYPGTEIIDRDSRVLRRHESRLHLTDERPHRRLRGFLRKAPGCNPVFGVFRAEILGGTGLIGGFESSDYILLAETCLRAWIHEIPEPLFQRRDHSGMSRRAATRGRDLLRWFDTRSGSRNARPEIRLLRELFRAIGEAPLGRTERWRCYGEIAAAGAALGRACLAWNNARKDPERMY